MPRNAEKIEEKKRVLESARKFQNTRKDIIDLFEKGIFPYRGNVFKTKEESKENKFFDYIENESKGSTMICLESILVLKHLLS